MTQLLKKVNKVNGTQREKEEKDRRDWNQFVKHIELKERIEWYNY